MKRDLPLLHRLLRTIRDTGSHHLEGVDPSVLLYHLDLALQEGFVDGVKVMRAVDNNEASTSGNPALTWKGHNFLEQARKT